MQLLVEGDLKTRGLDISYSLHFLQLEVEE